MGATKRMCEMIYSLQSMYGHVKYSATRFGNVLGSAKEVLFHYLKDKLHYLKTNCQDQLH